MRHCAHNPQLVFPTSMLRYVLSSDLTQVVITSPPQDTTVVEGGYATFQCIGEDNGSPVIFGLQLTPSRSGTSVVLITGTNLTGIEMVTVSIDAQEEHPFRNSSQPHCTPDELEMT